MEPTALFGQNRIIGSRLIRGTTAAQSPIAGLHGRRGTAGSVVNHDPSMELPSFMIATRSRAQAYRKSQGRVMDLRNAT